MGGRVSLKKGVWWEGWVKSQKTISKTAMASVIILSCRSV